MSFSFNNKCSKETTLGLLEALIEMGSPYMKCPECDDIYNFSEEIIKHRTITLLKCFNCNYKIRVKDFLKINDKNIVNMIKISGINKNDIPGYIDYKKKISHY